MTNLAVRAESQSVAEQRSAQIGIRKPRRFARISRLLAFLLVCCGSFGCVVVKYTPSLDKELTEAGQRFLATRSVVVREGEKHGDELSEWLGHSVNPYEESLVLSLHRKPSPNLTNIMNLLSLYLIPVQSWQGGTLTAVSGTTGEQFEQPFFAGRWLGLITWLFWFSPGWEIDQQGGEERRDSKRAFYTLINRIAAEREASEG